MHSAERASRRTSDTKKSPLENNLLRQVLTRNLISVSFELEDGYDSSQNDFIDDDNIRKGSNKLFASPAEDAQGSDLCDEYFEEDKPNTDIKTGATNNCNKAKWSGCFRSGGGGDGGSGGGDGGGDVDNCVGEQDDCGILPSDTGCDDTLDSHKDVKRSNFSTVCKSDMPHPSQVVSCVETDTTPVFRPFDSYDVGVLKSRTSNHTRIVDGVSTQKSATITGDKLINVSDFVLTSERPEKANGSYSPLNRAEDLEPENDGRNKQQMSSKQVSNPKIAQGKENIEPSPYDTATGRVVTNEDHQPVDLLGVDLESGLNNCAIVRKYSNGTSLTEGDASSHVNRARRDPENEEVGHQNVQSFDKEKTSRSGEPQDYTPTTPVRKSSLGIFIFPSPLQKTSPEIRENKTTPPRPSMLDAARYHLLQTTFRRESIFESHKDDLNNNSNINSSSNNNNNNNAKTSSSSAMTVEDTDNSKAMPPPEFSPKVSLQRKAGRILAKPCTAPLDNSGRCANTSCTPSSIWNDSVRPFGEHKSDNGTGIGHSLESPPLTPVIRTIVRRKDLKFGPVIGKGGFGCVHKGYLQGRPVAIKVVQKRRGSGIHREILQAERLAFSLRLRHDHIVHILGVNVCDDFRGEALIVMELASSQTLQDLLDDACARVTQADRIRFGIELTSALHYLHAHNLVHLDVKPKNVLLRQDGRTKLADFGNLMRTNPGVPREDTDFTQILGTLPYRAPELMRGQFPSCLADIYSLGITLWQMGSREMPHAGANPHWLIYQVTKANRRPECHYNGSDVDELRYCALYKECWDPHPGSRPNAHGVLEVLHQLRDGLWEDGCERDS